MRVYAVREQGGSLYSSSIASAQDQLGSHRKSGTVQKSHYNVQWLKIQTVMAGCADTVILQLGCRNASLSRST